jgi:hypothetical protein
MPARAKPLSPGPGLPIGATQEDMFNDPYKCYEECNSRECLHNNFACNYRAKSRQCEAAQADIASTLTTIPAYFDAKTLTTFASVADSAATPVRVGIRIGEMELHQDTDTGQITVQLPFDMIMQWQDSRLETSPCAYVYQDQLSRLQNNVSQMMWLPQFSMTASDMQTNATITYRSKSFELGNNASWIAGIGPTDPTTGEPYEACHKCATMNFSAVASLALQPLWNFWYFPFDVQNISFVLDLTDSDLSTTCADILAPMDLQTANDIKHMLPQPPNSGPSITTTSPTRSSSNRWANWWASRAHTVHALSLLSVHSSH